MKAISDARLAIERERTKKLKERAELDSQIYRLGKAIEAIDKANGLQRIRHVSHKVTCVHCGDEFSAGTATARVCQKQECKTKRNRAKRRGTTLIAGAK